MVIIADEHIGIIFLGHGIHLLQTIQFNPIVQVKLNGVFSLCDLQCFVTSISQSSIRLINTRALESFCAYSSAKPPQRSGEPSLTSSIQVCSYKNLMSSICLSIGQRHSNSFDSSTSEMSNNDNYFISADGT